jgi:hypothetical protein
MTLTKDSSIVWVFFSLAGGLKINEYENESRFVFVNKTDHDENLLDPFSGQFELDTRLDRG